jgi:hypothetical protein
VSVEQTDVVDILGIDRKTGHVVLTTSDHLDWSDSIGHQTILQKKVNTYLALLKAEKSSNNTPKRKADRSHLGSYSKFHQTSQDGPLSKERDR